MVAWGISRVDSCGILLMCMLIRNVIWQHTKTWDRAERHACNIAIYVYISLKNLSKPRWHVPGWPESVKEVLTSGSGGLPSLKQINGSVLIGTFSMFTLPWEKYELWARMQRNHNVLNKNFDGFWGSFSRLWARIQDIPK